MRKTRTTVFFFLILWFPLLAWAQNFAIVADSHVGARDSEWGATVKRLEDENVQTIIHVGDAIEFPGSLRQWKRFFELTGPEKTLHLVPGNHDIADERSLKVYLRFFPDTYYSFSEGDTLFVILNTELPGQARRIAGNQLAWLTKELDKPFQYKFVFLHEAPYPIVRLHGLDIHEEARDALHRLFVQKGVALVVAGHDHAYRRTVRDSTVYVIAPRSRRISYLLIGDGEPGYILADRKGKGYSFTVKDIQGKVRDTFTIIDH